MGSRLQRTEEERIEQSLCSPDRRSWLLLRSVAGNPDGLRALDFHRPSHHNGIHTLIAQR